LTGREDGLQRAVRIYTRSGDRWTESATIAAPGVAPFEFLRAIALSPDRLVVYVQASENAWHRELSRLVVYDRADHWRETADFAAPRDVATDEPALAIDGDTIAVGEPPPRSSDEANRGAGAVHLFTRSGSGWNATARFDTCAPDAGAFGASVDLDAGLLAVGSGPSRGGGAGDVHLFASTNGAWQPRGRIAAADADPTSVALSGGNLLAGTTSAPSAALFDVAATEPTPPAACPTVPEQWPIPDWRVEPPAAHGMNPVLLEQARSYAFQPGKHTQGVVIVRHGVIVAEWYEAGRDADSYAASWSMAKSVSSAVIGIALERGLVDGVDASLATFVPEWSGTDRARITLRNVLQMTSGLDWTEDYALQPQQPSDIARLASTERDQLAYVLARPLAHEPGSYWAYSSGDSMLLSAVIESATRRSMGDFAREVLFAPLGMQRAEWWSDAVGHTLSYCCVDAPTREFARFGLLYARGGRWGDDRLLSPEWVRDSTTTVRFADSIPSYGYQWWLAGDDLLARDAMFSARGWDGQYTYVFPNLDLVVVRSGHYDKDPGPPVADPTLFAHYPSAGLVPGRGTLPPEGGWDDARFLRPIVDAIVD
jgi:CubicO group peptidase (beta-lactamase class C family)